VANFLGRDHGHSLTLARGVYYLSIVSPNHALFDDEGRFKRISLDMHVREHATYQAYKAYSKQAYIESKVEYVTKFMNGFTATFTMEQYREQLSYTYDIELEPPLSFTPNPSMYIF